MLKISPTRKMVQTGSLLPVSCGYEPQYFQIFTHCPQCLPPVWESYALLEGCVSKSFTGMTAFAGHRWLTLGLVKLLSECFASKWTRSKQKWTRNDESWHQNLQILKQLKRQINLCLAVTFLAILMWMDSLCYLTYPVVFSRLYVLNLLAISYLSYNILVHTRMH